MKRGILGDCSIHRIRASLPGRCGDRRAAIGPGAVTVIWAQQYSSALTLLLSLSLALLTTHHQTALKVSIMRGSHLTRGDSR
eukprot:23707-Eustigmatos_ZCMA.PRE.1